MLSSYREEKEMPAKYKISLKKIIDEFHLEEFYLPDEAEKIMITSPEVDRPGLALTGFYDIFNPERIQVMGKAEHGYLATLSKESEIESLDLLMSKKPSVLIIASGFEPHSALRGMAEKYGVAVVTSKAKTSHLIANMITWLNVQLAPRITRHGGFVEVYGEGLLLIGDSGIGKSETAIELVKRGHRLIADDAVEIKRVSAKTLVGSAPAIIKHSVELRGIGIVDVRRLFGMGAVKETEKIDLVINLEHWIQGKMYDRLGLDDEKIEILGNEIPQITIPVMPGRNLAIILEIAAMNHRQKKMGYNTAEEFNKRLMEQMGITE